VAAVIAALSVAKLPLEEALKAGCRVAGNKVGQRGFKNLKRFFVRM
jgi:hypothetical protein